MSEQNWQDETISARDGLKLHARVYGSRDTGRLPVLCLAGLTRNASDFHQFASHLSQRSENPRMVVCLDLRGRGGSEWDRDWRNYTLQVEADDVLHAVTGLGLGDILLVGTSRGGLLAHVLACSRPGILAGVVLNDIGPEIDGTGLARLKGYVGRLAMPGSWKEAARQMQDMLGAKFPAVDEAAWEIYARGTYVEENGKLKSSYDPRLSKGLEQIDLAEDVVSLWPQFQALGQVPLMTLRGEHSDILSEETFAAMKELRPDMRALVVEGHGHAPLLMREELIRQIGDFLDWAEKRRGH